MARTSKRIVITNEKAVKALNLMAAFSDKDATDIATEAVLRAWDEKAAEIREKVDMLSPVSAVMGQTEQEATSPVGGLMEEAEKDQ